MGVYNYKDLGDDESRALSVDALALISTSGISEQSNEIIASVVREAGWTPLSGSTLGYDGSLSSRGAFTGEKAGYATAEAEVLGKYDASGKLTGLGVMFHGTNDPADWVYNLGLLTNVEGLAKNYVGEAFDTLLGSVARYAQANGLTGNDILVSGVSLGGHAANSMADLSASRWSGFYQDANYVAFASPSQASGDKVLNIGYEQDPVFRVLDGYTSELPSLLAVHDTPQPSATNNLVNFNEVYALGPLVGEGIFPIINPLAWLSHGGADGFARVAESQFYNLTSRDSTIVVSNLSDLTRGNLWVQDLENYAEPHTGGTFIIGTDSADRLQGGAANDYLEGRAGDDTFRDSGGYNIILGGAGNNTLELQQSVNGFEFANDGEGMLYMQDTRGGISLIQDVDTLVSKESSWIFFNRDVTYNVTEQGLLSADTFTEYAPSGKGDANNNVLVAQSSGSWLFGQGSADLLIGGQGDDVLVGGAGNDVILAGAGADTFLFNGDFGLDFITGFKSTDKLAFVGVEGVEGVDEQYSYLDHAQTVGINTVLTFGDNSVTLVGVGLGSLSADNIAIA
ncbi:calcium-binding protein [Pseudomonas gessardii]|uniref:polyurethane esterase n=1 Tax=Pseudomonas gessardii TaxID=78544 RepID=UPI001475F365|nr:calcium-binding protein [Pseudomonas gessardii]NNA70464.1 calcium-binding protein [Pseudomonas gessardii]